MDVKTLITEFNIPVVEQDCYVENPAMFMNYVKDLKNAEGFVIRWATGYRVKIKADDYVRIHKARDSLTQEKNVIDMILNQLTDDIKSMLPDEERLRLDKYEQGFWIGVHEAVSGYQAMFDTLFVDQAGGDRKRFAIECVPLIQADPWAAGIMFAMADGKAVRDQVIDRIAKSLSTQPKVDKARSLWNNSVTWNYQWDGDA